MTLQTDRHFQKPGQILVLLWKLVLWRKNPGFPYIELYYVIIVNISEYDVQIQDQGRKVKNKKGNPVAKDIVKYDVIYILFSYYRLSSLSQWMLN